MTKLTLLEFLTFDAVCAELELSAHKTGRFVAGGVPEQSSHALEKMDRGTAVGRTPAGLNKSPQASTLLAEQEPMTASSNRRDVYSKAKARISVMEEYQALSDESIYSSPYSVGCLE